jgi:1-acyl-sn-glycerol-3-phosphate acyltransferase
MGFGQAQREAAAQAATPESAGDVDRARTWENVSVFYWLTKMTLGMTLKIIFRPRASGVRHVPRKGPVIIASNHLSFSDHFFGPLPVPRKVIFLAKAEYFTGRGVKGLISRVFFTGVGQIPVDRGGGMASEQAIRTGLRVLAAGHVLGIYPEGTRSPDGRLYRGKTGVARLAIESGAPVVPCAMINTFQFQPPGTIWPNMRFRPGVRFGEPLDFSRYRGQEADGALLRTITDEIMQAIAKLSGQEYVDIDARRAKAELSAVGGDGGRVGGLGGGHDGDGGDGDRDGDSSAAGRRSGEGGTGEGGTGEGGTGEGGTGEGGTGEGGGENGDLGGKGEGEGIP